MSTIRHIGLLIDTFDPPHAGHIAVAEKALKHGLDEIWLLPAAQDRDMKASAVQRLDMCRLAVKGHKKLKVHRTAIKYPGTPEETRERLKKKYTDSKFTILEGTEETAKESRKLQVRIAGYEDPKQTDTEVLRYIAGNGLYIPDRIPELSAMISQKRLQHTLGVRQTAVELAVRFKGPVIKSAVAALLHDCAKGMPDDELLKTADEHCPIAKEAGMHTYPVLHGPVGAYLAKEKFGIRDEEILNAIIYHTIGRPDMTLLDLIIFVADAIEPNREDYPALQAIRKAAKKNLAEAAYISIRGTCDYLTSAGKPMDPASYVTMECLKKQLDGKHKKK